MSDFTPKPNIANENHGKNKTIVAVVSVCVALAVILITFFVAKKRR